MSSIFENEERFKGYIENIDPRTKISKGVKPLFDYWIRDTHITLGGDGYYYLTGTTRTPGIENARLYNDGIRMWRSNDLSNWQDMGLVWSFEKDATWQNQFKRRIDESGNFTGPGHRSIYAPEIHFIKDNYYITASINWPVQVIGEEPSKTFLLRSKSGRAEGPYENVGDGPLTSRIDSSLFVDDDGTVYYVWQDGRIARMKDDMSGFAEKPMAVVQRRFDPEPYCEGVFIFKHNNKYHLCLAIWIMNKNGKFGYFPGTLEDKISYDCVIASSDNIYGPYGDRYTSITGGGHNSFFKDKQGKWWATMFGNPVADSYAPFYARPAIIPMKWDESGKIFPYQDCL